MKCQSHAVTSTTMLRVATERRKSEAIPAANKANTPPIKNRMRAGQQINKRAARRGGHIEPVRSQLPPSRPLPEKKNETEQQRNCQPGNPRIATDGDFWHSRRRRARNFPPNLPARQLHEHHAQNQHSR